MSRFTDGLYRHWLGRNGSGGMGLRPMSRSSRATDPTAQGTRPPARLVAVGAPSTPLPVASEERSIEHETMPRCTSAANDDSYSRPKKPDFKASDYVDKS